MNKLMTIKEYAKKEKISVQRVYQKLNKELKPYVKVINGKKYIDIELLDNDNKKEIQIKNTEENENETMLQILKNQIEFANEQLKAKDSQIESLNKQLEAMTERLQEANIINHNNQVLLLESKKSKDKKHFWNIWKEEKE